MQCGPDGGVGRGPRRGFDLRGGEPDFNARAMLDFLHGRKVPFRTTALLNAASAIVADGHQLPDEQASLARRFKDAYAIASEAVDSGKAIDVLNRWIAVAKDKALRD
mgnify:CR=1 FL=1